MSFLECFSAFKVSLFIQLFGKDFVTTMITLLQ